MLTPGGLQKQNILTNKQISQVAGIHTKTMEAVVPLFIEIISHHTEAAGC